MNGPDSYEHVETKYWDMTDYIISLWQVPDESTSELMVLFYKNYLSGQSKVVALKNAQLELKKNYPSPYYWAGFILMD